MPLFTENKAFSPQSYFGIDFKPLELILNHR